MTKKCFVLFYITVAILFSLYSSAFCLAQDLPSEVTQLLQQCLKSPDALPQQAVDALQLAVNRNEAAIRDLFAKEAVKIGGGGDKGAAFQKKVFDAIDRRQFQLADELAKQVAAEMGDGVEMVIRTGSSGSRHMQLHGAPPPDVRYDLLVSDDDISFVGTKAEEAAAKFNALKKSKGLGNARSSAFSLSSITDATSYDLLVQQIRNPDAFVGAAGFGKIRQEIVEKGGAVILTRQGNKIVPLAQSVQDYVAKNAGSTLADIMDVAAIAADLKKFGPLTMYASAIRQMGHANITQREQIKYLLRIHVAMDAAGTFADAAEFGGRQVTYFKELGEQLKIAYSDKSGKMAAALLKRHDVMAMQLDAFESVMLSTTRKLQRMVAQAEKEAGKGAVNIARHPELRRLIHELAAGFALLHQTGHARIMKDVVPGMLKALGSSAGNIDIFYKVLYTAAVDAKTLTSEAAQEGVARGVSTWSKVRTPEGLITAMSEAGQNGKQVRQTLAEIGAKRMQGKGAEGATQLQKVLAESNGDAFLWKMLSSQTAQKFLIEGIAMAPFATWTMYQEWQKGEMKDLSDAAFVLIDFVPGGMSTKKLGTEGLTPSTVLMFAKEALYFTPAWPFVLAGDVMYLSWTVGGAIQLQTVGEGLVDILVYAGDFEVGEEGAKLTGVTLPDGTTYSRDGVFDFLFKTKAVRVRHAISGLEYYVNNLSEKSFKVLDGQFIPQDATMEQMRLAIQQHLDAINWSEASKYFYQGNVGGVLAGYVNYVAGFEFVVSADKGKPWAKLYDHLKNQMANRRTVVAQTIMVPQLILLAEQKRATLDASKTLPQELAALQKKFEQVRGSALEVQLVDAVEAQAKKTADALTRGTAEDKLLASGQVWQEALAAYRRVWELSATITATIEERTGYAHAKPLAFVWTGNPKDDLRKAEQSKAGFASDLAKTRRDLLGIAKREPDLSDSVDRQAYDILARVIFPWRTALDKSGNDGSIRTAAFTKEYDVALEKVRALYGLSQDLQTQVERGAALTGEQGFLVLDKAMSVELRVKDDALQKEIQQGGLKITWLAAPGCTVKSSDALQARVTTHQLAPVTITAVFERTGATKAKAALAVTLPVRVGENFLAVNVAPATVKPGQSLKATADIPDRFLGAGGPIYRWECENCRLDNKDRSTVGLSAGQPGQGRVRVDVLVVGPDGKMQSLTSGQAMFTVLDKPEPPKSENLPAPNEILPPLPSQSGIEAGGGSTVSQTDTHQGGADSYKPSCSYEYSDWGECDRSTKKQTRTVIKTSPVGCVERQKPVLEQGCTPPPTEEEKRHAYLNCLCRCSSGWAGHIGVWYDPEGKVIPECESSGPCIGGIGAFGCSRRHFFGGSTECAQGCWEGAYGKGTYDAAKAMILSKQENKKYKKPLSVKINPSKNPVDYGEILTLNGEVMGGSGGLIWAWGGCAEPSDSGTTKVSTSPECKPCTASLTVTDQDGDSASASLDIQCNTLRVVISRQGEGPVSVGMPVAFSAQVLSGDKPISRSFVYRWQPHPEVVFDKLDADSPSVNAVFGKPGKVGVWVQVLEKQGESLATVGESDQLELDVVTPELELIFDPKDPLVGQEVKAKFVAKPDVTEMDLRWMPLPLNAHQGVLSENGRELSMYLKDDKPVQVTVMARVPVSGEALGMAQGSISARKYAVNVTGPKAMGPPPQVWKEGVGLVTEEKAIAVHQVVEFSVAMQPEVTTGALTYQWKVQSGGCSISNPTSRDARVTASEAGSCELVVGVRDKNGVELGTGQGAFSASVTQDMINQGKQKAKNVEEAKAKAQSAKAKATKGDYDGAISDAESAVSLDPANSEAKSLAQRLRQEKETMDRQMAKAKALMVENRFAEARKEFIIASNISSSYPQVQKFDLELKNKQSKYEQEVRRKIDEVRSLNEKKEFAKALDIATAWRSTTKLDATADKELKIQEDWAGKWQSIKDKQLALIKAGMDKARSGDFAGAMQDFDAGFANQSQIFHGQEVEVIEAKKIQSEAAQKQKRLDEILTQVGQAVAKDKELTPEAANAAQQLVEEGLAMQPGNTKLQAWKTTLQTVSPALRPPTVDTQAQNIAGQDASSAEARKFWADAQALQNNYQYAEAIAKYKAGLAISPNPVIEDRVKKLQKYLAQSDAAKSALTAKGAATKPSQASPTNTEVPAPSGGASSPTATSPQQGGALAPTDTTTGNCRCEDWDSDGRFGVVLNGNVLRSNIGPYEECMRYLESLGQCSGTDTATGVQSGGQTASQAGRQAAAALQPVGGDAVNLALGKPATQSSTYAGTGVDQGPHHAVDGKTSGRDPHDLIHTNYEANPWWRVDLGADAAIQRVRIHNRTNPEVKANLSLELLVSQDGRNWTSVYGHDRTVFTVLDLPVAVSGRHVMARLNSDHDALQLYEIEVWGRMTGGAAASEKVGAGTDTTSPPVSESSPSADASTLATSAALPAGWRNEQVGNVSFAVPASWGVVTENEPEVEMLHLHWDGDFDSPLHGISAGIALDWARAKAELPGGRVVRLGGVDVVRYDDGPAINLLFPEMSGNRGVLMVVFQGPGGNPGVIESVLQTIRVGSGEGDQDPSPVSPSGTPEVSFEVGNIYGVYNGPTQPTVFTLNAPRVLALIQNYHWNSAQGATPGTISLQDAGGRTYGPWQAEGSPGQGGVPNAYWTARPMVLLPAGTYTVTDSDPASWAHNPESEGRGFSRIETLAAH